MVGRRGSVFLAWTVLLMLVASIVAGVPVYSTREEALARTFPPPATIERETHFLTDGQREQASRLAQAKVDSSLVVAYLGRGASGILGTAYFDTHLVRTETETLLVMVKPDGSVGGVEIVAFGEPEDYRPRPRWLRLFERRKLDSELALGRGLAHVSGATLTVRAITAGVRRVLAIHAVLSGDGKP